MSDQNVVRLPRSAPPPSTRDPRIDAFRGLALAMIIVTHLPGNPWEALTIREWGFSDAAEAFFIMSGIAAGIAYSPAVARWLDGAGRLWDAISPMWSRAWTLYLVQTLLTVIALALFAWAADAFWNADFRRLHNLGLIHTETGAALAGIPTLGYQIGYVNILPSYIILMLAAPVMIAGGLRAPRTTLLVAVAIWFVAGYWRLNIPNHPGGGGWFLAPASWQLIFVVGLLIGTRHRRRERLVPATPALLWTAIVFLAFVFAWRHIPPLGVWMNHKMAQLGALGAPYHIVSHSKTFLAAPRLIHILALTYVISCLPIIRTACAHAWAEPIRLLGRQGLLVFSLGTVLCLAGQILMRVEPDRVLISWLLPPAVIALCLAAAWIRTWLVAPARRDHPAVSRNSPMAAPAEARRGTPSSA